jgi:carbon-monoxide dehydrogenase medium subunit
MRFHSAETLPEALDLLAEHGDEARLLAGGSDVMVQYQRGELDPAFLLHLERIDALRAFSHDNGHIGLGALVTHRSLGSNAELARSLPALAEACRTVGGWQTQEVGTIAGNVANASPAADTVPPLLVAGAVVHLASTSGRRSQPIGNFLLGRRQTTRQPDELITSIDVEPVGERSGEVYLKVGPRSAMEVALVGLAVRLAFGDDDQVADARMAVCSVAPVPYRCVEAERALVGSPLDDEHVAEAGRLLAASADPIDDPRASAAYRKRILAPLLGRAIGICRERAKGGA